MRNHLHTYALIKSVLQESVQGVGIEPVGEPGMAMLGFALFGSLGNGFYFNV